MPSSPPHSAWPSRAPARRPSSRKRRARRRCGRSNTGDVVRHGLSAPSVSPFVWRHCQVFCSFLLVFTSAPVFHTAGRSNIHDREFFFNGPQSKSFPPRPGIVPGIGGRGCVQEENGIERCCPAERWLVHGGSTTVLSPRQRDPSSGQFDAGQTPARHPRRPGGTAQAPPRKIITSLPSPPYRS